MENMFMVMFMQQCHKKYPETRLYNVEVQESRWNKCALDSQKILTMPTYPHKYDFTWITHDKCFYIIQLMLRLYAKMTSVFIGSV